MKKEIIGLLNAFVVALGQDGMDTSYEGPNTERITREFAERVMGVASEALHCRKPEFAAQSSGGVGTPPNRSSNQAGAEPSGSGLRSPSLSNEHPQSTSPSSEPRCRVEGCGLSRYFHEGDATQYLKFAHKFDCTTERRKGQRRKHEEQLSPAGNRFRMKWWNWWDDAQINIRTIPDRRKASATIAELRRFKALEEHLPEGFSIGDDATAELAVQLSEMKQRAEQAEQEQDEFKKIRDTIVSLVAIGTGLSRDAVEESPVNAIKQLKATAAELRELLQKSDGLLYAAQLELNDWIARHGADIGLKKPSERLVDEVTALRQRIQKARNKKGQK